MVLFALLVFINTAFTQELLGGESKKENSVSQDQSATLSAEETLTLEQMKEIEKIYENFFHAIQGLLDDVYGSLSGLSAMIMGDQVPTIINKGKAHSALKQINMMISSLRNQKMMVVEPMHVISLVKITKAFAIHIHKSLDNNLKSIEEFDIKSALVDLQNLTQEECHPQAIAKELMLIEKIVKKIKCKTETIGLAWYNKAYRGITNSSVVQVTNKYSLHKWIPLAYGALVLGYWILGSAQETKNEPVVLHKQTIMTEEGIPGTSLFEKTRLIPGFLKRIFGPLPFSQGRGATPTNINKLSIGGQLENGLSTLNSGNLPISAAIVGYAATAAYEKWSNSIRPWFGKKLNYVHNFLKGGIYLKEAARLNGITQEVYFKDVVGLDHVKETFSKIVHYLKDPEYYARRGLVPEKGILLVGGTRTGKSYSVTALFNEIKKAQLESGALEEFKFYSLSGTDIRGNGGFANIMRIARHEAPCILFIDEIDLLSLQRGGENPMLGEFLTCMSGALSNDDPKKQVIIIAATNNPENLDSALRASGRLSKELRFELPSHEDRVIFLEKQLEKLCLDKGQFDVTAIANQTDGKSYETLKELVNGATLFAAINGRVVTQQDILLTIDKELRKIVTIDSRVIPNEEKTIIATHFAGPALYLGLTNSRIKVTKVTTRQVMTAIGERWAGAHLMKNDTRPTEEEKRFEYGGFFTHYTGDTGNVFSYEEKRALCSMHLSGIVAEEILLGACGYSCNKNSMFYARQVAKSIAFEGVDADTLPESIRTEYHRKVLQLIEECKQELRLLFREHKDTLQFLRNELFTKETLEEADILKIIAQNAKTESTVDTFAQAINS